MTPPETRYAKTTDGVRIAYQVLGDGPVDLVFVIGWVSNVELAWDEPRVARYYRRLASFSRLILFDKRGTGLSDRVPDRELPDLETRMDDVRAVMDAAGSERAVVYALALGSPMSILFAATLPERLVALILHGPVARTAWAPDWPWGLAPEEHRGVLEQIEREWGTTRFATSILREVAPSLTGDERFAGWLATFLRRSASPGSAVALERMNFEMDVRHVLPAIRVPTLVLNRVGDEPEESREIAARIPGARHVELPGNDSLYFVGDQDSILDELERFVRDVWRERAAELDRVLATVLVTDIVDSTKKAAELGDRRWKDLLDNHHAEVRGQLARFRGKEIDTAGDGFLATFDGPARAVKCAMSIAEAVKPLSIEVRAGVHTGEIELAGDDVRGIAVHIGARVAGLANPSEVLVSSTVKDLTAGSGLEFEDRGEHELKGVPGRWNLYRVVGSGS